MRSMVEGVQVASEHRPPPPPPTQPSLRRLRKLACDGRFPSPAARGDESIGWVRRRVRPGLCMRANERLNPRQLLPHGSHFRPRVGA
jgi:hypothetical protein